MERADLEAVAHLPDAVEDGSVSLVIGGKAPLTTQIWNGVERDLLQTAERFRIGVPQTRERVCSRALPAMAEPLRDAGLQRMIGGAREVCVHRDDAPIRVGAQGAVRGRVVRAG